MENEITEFIKVVKQNTDIDISLFDKEGNFLCGLKTFDKIPTNFAGVYTNVKLDKTFFRIKLKNNEYIVCILGSTKNEKNYAFFISSLSEHFAIQESFLGKEDFLKAVILGETNTFKLDIYTKKFSINSRYNYVMKIIYSENKSEDIISVLKAYGGEDGIVIQMELGSIAFLKYFDNVMEDSGLSNEYAEVLAQSIYEETGEKVKIGIGGEAGEISKIAVSYKEASEALRIAKDFNMKGNVFAYRDFVLIKILEDIPKVKLGDYFSLIAKADSAEIFSDKEMIETAEAFLENNLNSSETSRKMYLHRNTLLYRLEKIEKQTGLDIRKFSDAITFKTALYLYRLIRGNR